MHSLSAAILSSQIPSIYPTSHCFPRLFLCIPQAFAAAIAGDAAIVDFYADWCGPCKQIAPSYAALAAENTNVKFYKVNVDDLEDVAEDQNVSAMPTFKLYSKGACISTVQGANIAAIKTALGKFA